MFIEYNPNPGHKIVDDCVIRAICKITGKKWLDVYFNLMMKGSEYYDWPMKNYIWGNYLKDLGFRRRLIPDSCPDCYTVKDFCKDHQIGHYILALSNHAVAVVDGNYYDTADVGDEAAIYYWERKEI